MPVLNPPCRINLDKNNSASSFGVPIMIRQNGFSINFEQTLHLLLNAAKTKELIFDFRHCNISHVPLSIDNAIVEICDNFKYLGITFDCKLK